MAATLVSPYSLNADSALSMSSESIRCCALIAVSMWLRFVSCMADLPGSVHDVLHALRHLEGEESRAARTARGVARAKTSCHPNAWIFNLFARCYEAKSAIRTMNRRIKSGVEMVFADKALGTSIATQIADHFRSTQIVGMSECSMQDVTRNGYWPTCAEWAPLWGKGKGHGRPSQNDRNASTISNER
jgi:hypothetical protein